MRIFFGILLGTLFSVSTIVGLKVCYPLISYLLKLNSMLRDPLGILALILGSFATLACLNAAIRNFWLTKTATSIPVLATVFGLLGMLLIAALVVLFYVVSRLGH